MTLLVSIVIPVYNSEYSIRKCLDSLINQTYANIEIICINDCSKDNSLAVLEEYAQKDERIIIINHLENKNAGGARNSGVKAAKGEYICFVDNDDWLALNAIELLIENSNNGNADLVASDWITYYSDDKQCVNKNLPSNTNNQEKLIYICKNGYRMLGCLFRKSLFTNNELYYPEYIFFEDNAIAFTLFCYCKKISYIPIPLYYYAISSTSVTGFTSITKIHDRITTSKMHISNLKKHGFYNQNKEWFNFVCLRLCCGTLHMIAQYKHKEIKEELERNALLINSILPNEHFNEFSSSVKVAFKYPLLFYYHSRLGSPLFAIYRFLKNLLKNN